MSAVQFATEPRRSRASANRRTNTYSSIYQFHYVNAIFPFQSSEKQQDSSVSLETRLLRQAGAALSLEKLAYYLLKKKKKTRMFSSRNATVMFQFHYRTSNCEMLLELSGAIFFFLANLRLYFLLHSLKNRVVYDTSAIQLFVTSMSLQREPEAGSAIRRVEKKFLGRVSYENLYHEVRAGSVRKSIFSPIIILLACGHPVARLTSSR